jgi:glutamate racemase
LSDVHLVITDSGLGGLTVCAALEQALRAGSRCPRLTYVNAWPESGRGYNDLPDMPARARVFDRVLDRIAGMRPDTILIACNTLSIVYEHTRFKASAGVSVRGIVHSGVEQFREALSTHHGSAIVLVGTRTTIESGVHQARLIARGIAPARISGAPCHGLATAIERGPESDATVALIATCAERAAAAAPPGEPLFLGLACTHYGMVAGRLAGAVAARSGRAVVPLDPNMRMVDDVLARLAGDIPHLAPGDQGVEVISKVELSTDQREGVGRLLESSSPATAAALRAYTHVPDFF